MDGWMDGEGEGGVERGVREGEGEAGERERRGRGGERERGRERTGGLRAKPPSALWVGGWVRVFASVQWVGG